jgi:hypothetical protein
MCPKKEWQTPNVGVFSACLASRRFMRSEYVIDVLRIGHNQDNLVFPLREILYFFSRYVRPAGRQEAG